MSGRAAGGGTQAAQFSRWGLGRRSIPAKQPVMKPARPSSPGGGSAGDPSRLNRVASRRSSLRFGRNTPGPVLPVGAPPSRALSAGRLAPTGRAGRPRRSRGFHHRLFTASLRAAHRCVSAEIHSGQFSRWGLLPHAPCQPGASPPPGELAGLGAHAGSTTGCSPRRFAPLVVAFRSKYTRASSPGGGSSLTRLVSRTPTGRTGPRQPRRSRGFHHRLLPASLRAAHRCVSVEIHSVFLPHAPCQPGASPASALTRVPPPSTGDPERGGLALANRARRGDNPPTRLRCGGDPSIVLSG